MVVELIQLEYHQSEPGQGLSWAIKNYAGRGRKVGR